MSTNNTMLENLEKSREQIQNQQVEETTKEISEQIDETVCVEDQKALADLESELARIKKKAH
jgi:hypothetical protein